MWVWWEFLPSLLSPKLKDLEEAGNLNFWVKEMLWPPIVISWD